MAKKFGQAVAYLFKVQKASWGRRQFNYKIEKRTTRAKSRSATRASVQKQIAKQRVLTFVEGAVGREFCCRQKQKRNTSLPS